jgi:hypothetical protein
LRSDLGKTKTNSKATSGAYEPGLTAASTPTRKPNFERGETWKQAPSDSSRRDKMSDAIIIDKSKEFNILYNINSLLKYNHCVLEPGLCNLCSDFVLAPPGAAWGRVFWEPGLVYTRSRAGCRLCAIVLQQLGRGDERRADVFKDAIITAETRKSDGLTWLRWDLRFPAGRELIQADMLIQYFKTRMQLPVLLFWSAVPTMIANYRLVIIRLTLRSSLGSRDCEIKTSQML